MTFSFPLQGIHGGTNVQRIIGIIASALVPLSCLPLGALAAEHERPTDRPAVRAPRAVVREEYARPVERERYAPHPVVREQYAPHQVVREHYYEPRPAVREQYSTPRYEPRPVVREYAPRAVARPIVNRYIAPRAQYHEVRRNGFVRYYSPHYFTYQRAPGRIVFQRYIPRRIFVAPPVQIVRTYVTQPVYYGAAPVPVNYVYSGYMPIYGSSPAITSVYYGYNGYNTYPYATPYPYQNQVGYGYSAPYGVNPFGNAQLQGVVLSDTNGGVLLLTPSLQPLFVNTAIAEQNGYVQGNISPGSFVNVFGYNTGNEFIATAMN